jgi:hypothetical protein
VRHREPQWRDPDPEIQPWRRPLRAGFPPLLGDRSSRRPAVHKAHRAAAVPAETPLEAAAALQPTYAVRDGFGRVDVQVMTDRERDTEPASLFKRPRTLAPIKIW